MTETETVAVFVDARLRALAPYKSQKEVAKKAGFSNPNFLSMIKSGTAKLSIERVNALATALECNPTTLMELALRQFYSPDVVEQITHCSEPYVTDAEFTLIFALRKFIEGSRPGSRQSVAPRHIPS